jgi:hypothetical protein
MQSVILPSNIRFEIRAVSIVMHVDCCQITSVIVYQRTDEAGGTRLGHFHASDRNSVRSIDLLNYQNWRDSGQDRRIQ